MKSIRILLSAVLIVLGFVFVSCKAEEEKVTDPKVEFIKGDEAKNAVVTGASNPAQVVDSVYAKINAKKYLGGVMLGFASEAIKEENNESVVVSVLCLDSPGVGINISNPLVSILNKEGDRWTFVRVPDEISREENLPNSLSDKKVQLDVEATGNKIIKRYLPKECVKSLSGK